VRSALGWAALVLAIGIAGAATGFPEIERAALDPGLTPIALEVSDDDRLLASLGESGTLAVLDTADVHADAATASTCSSPVALAFDRIDDEPRFYVACGDGTVVGVPVDTSTIPATLGDSELFELGSGALQDAVISTPDHRLFSVEDTGDSFLVHVVDLVDGTVDGLTGFPMTILFGAAAMTVTPLGTYVVIAHDDGLVTKLFNSTGVYSITTFDLLGLGSIVDAEAVDEGYAYLLESSGQLVQYWLTGDVNYMPMVSGLSTPRDLDIVTADGESYFYVVDDAGLLTVVPFTGGDPVAEVTLSLGGGDGLAGASADEGRIYVGAEGAVIVLSEGPWVEITSVTPEQAYEGDTVTLTFTVDEDSSYELVLGGDIEGSGEALSGFSGSASAGVPVDLEIEAVDLDEGENRLFVFATASGATGRDSDTVFVDTPPDSLAGLELGFGDGKLLVRWLASSEADIDHYLVHFADSYFEQASGAPGFTVEGDGWVNSSPASAEQGEPGEQVTYTLEGLTNGVEYCVAVLAVDTGGQEGPWTDTACDAPELTVGSGDDLGYCGSCSTRQGQTAGPGVVALLLVAAALRRSRRG
jgi:MYXO-CTERM domain-containing protein